VTSFVPSIRDKLEIYVDIPSVEQLRTAQKTTNEEKIQLWEQMKIGSMLHCRLFIDTCLAFTRTVSAMYGISLSLLFLRTEVNILGRYMYLDTIQNDKAFGTTDQEVIRFQFNINSSSTLMKKPKRNISPFMSTF
jgi:peroxin-3